jgi:hypothetical protein
MRKLGIKHTDAHTHTTQDQVKIVDKLDHGR